MGNHDDNTDQGASRMHWREIRWTPEPVERLEDVDALALATGELLAHVEALHDDVRWRRLLLSEALSTVSKLTDDLARAARLIEYQRQQLRQQRAAA